MVEKQNCAGVGFCGFLISSPNRLDRGQVDRLEVVLTLVSVKLNPGHIDAAKDIFDFIPTRIPKKSHSLDIFTGDGLANGFGLLQVEESGRIRNEIQADQIGSRADRSTRVVRCSDSTDLDAYAPGHLRLRNSFSASATFASRISDSPTKNA